MSKCGAIGSYCENRALRAHVWTENGPKTARTTTEFGLARPKEDMMLKTKNTPRLVRNAHFAHLGAPRRCQSVVLCVHMAKPRYSGRMFGRKNGPKTARTATEFGLARPNFNHSKALVCAVGAADRTNNTTSRAVSGH